MDSILGVHHMEQPVSVILDTKGRAVFTISPEALVAEAVELMNEKNIGALAVVDGGRLAGIFTERDVLRRIVDAQRDPKQTRVGEVMTSEVVYIRGTTTIEEALVIVTGKRCRHLPVMENEELVGMVSIGDLTRWVVSGQEHRIAELTEYISGNYAPHHKPEMNA